MPSRSDAPSSGWCGELALLVRRQRARLLQDAVGDGDLAEVVEPPGELELLDVLVVEPELARDRLDEERDALRVRARVRVLRVDDADEVLGRAKARLLLDAPLELVRAGGRRPPG